MAAGFVIKRNGQRVEFDRQKIVSAISRAYSSVYTDKPADESIGNAEKVAKSVMDVINAADKQEWNVEEIQDTVEKCLMEADPAVAKCYILYRHKRAEVRAFKASLGINDDDLKLPINSLMVLAARYLIKDENLKIKETPRQLFERVAGAVAGAEARYGKRIEEINSIAKEYFDAMTSFKFMPNSPTLMNAGMDNGQLSACFVIPVGDSMEEIFDAIKYAAIIHKTGGGTGFAFSRLRPHNDVVRSSSGIASGPISFMKIFDIATEQVKQGGKRRGANMGILRVDHPDILDFIMLKENEGVMRNFNISVAITEKFMKALAENKDYDLVNPRSGRAVGKLNARAVWNLIVTMAWKTGDPGLVFLDRINSSFSNPVPKYGPVESTNPCVTGDTLISTGYGLCRADALASRSSPNLLLVDGRFNKGVKQVSSPLFVSGIKPVVRLVTKEGFETKLTRDHKVYSETRGWVEAGMLKRGERIRVTNTGGSFGDEGTISEGRVLGWLVGGERINIGSSNKEAAVSFYGEDAELFADDVNRIIRSSESKSHIDEAGTVTVQKSTIASDMIEKFALDWGLDAEKLGVPERVFSGSEALQKGFIQALFEASGTASKQGKSRNAVRLTSMSEDLLREVQLLLLNFNIYSRIYKNRKKAENKLMPGSDTKVKGVHELIISGAAIFPFAEKIGFLSKHKSEKLNEAMHNCAEGKHPEQHDFTARFDSLVDCDPEPVYDLTEPATHSFIANGFVVANCGEQPLYPFDACNLGSINLAMMVKQTDHHFEVDWDELKRITRLGVRFLDDVIDANKYPLPQIKEVVENIRRIGLGVMGWADMLIKLGIRYDSNEALLLAEQVMSFISEHGRKMSQELAEERGPFPAFKDSIWYRLGYKPIRNSTVTTIAPTGTISIIAGGTSQGIEPIFSVVYLRNVRESLGYNLIEVNNEFERRALENGYYSEELMKDLAGKVSIQNVEEIPLAERRLFVTAYDIAPEWHVKMQAAFQKYVDNGVSKTINFPSWATPQDIETAYRLAYELGCKGITVYRDSSKSTQVLQAVDKDAQQKINKFTELKNAHDKEESRGISIAAIKEGAGTYVISSKMETKCSECGTGMIAAEGCFTCPKCGHSLCG